MHQTCPGSPTSCNGSRSPMPTSWGAKVRSPRPITHEQTQRGRVIEKGNIYHSGSRIVQRNCSPSIFLPHVVLLSSEEKECRVHPTRVHILTLTLAVVPSRVSRPTHIASYLTASTISSIMFRFLFTGPRLQTECRISPLYRMMAVVAKLKNFEGTHIAL